MNRDRLSLCEATDDAAWDQLVDASPQGTVFSKTGFLQSLDAPFRRYLVTDGNSPAALVAVVEDAAGQAVRVPFTPYQGILFVDGGQSTPRQRLQHEFALTEFVVGALTRRYSRIGMALSWRFRDLRPFLWHNYGEPAAGQFRTQPRYTALLDLRALDAGTYPSLVRQSRRQELRKAAAFPIDGAASLEDFMRLYARTFARQGITLDEPTLARVRRIAGRALQNGYGRLSACTTPAGIASMYLFLYDAKRAYYLFAANDPELRHTGAATRLMFDSILDAKRRGCAELDFVGVNSPARGDFKLSFNPELTLYFELDYAGGPGGPKAAP